MGFDNDLILRAARGEKIERYPVWVMRQAGRILPEYRAVRASLSGFKELVETPERAAEVTLQPVDILGVDAAIIFSDILVVPEAMGLPYQMIEQKGPWFEKTIRTKEDLDKLPLNVDVDQELSYVSEAIKIVKKELNGKIPLIGFAGAPWTIFCYMTEGSGSKTFAVSRKLLVQNESLAHRLIDHITDVTIKYLKMQIKAGADIIQIFDSWAGVLSKELYLKFALPSIEKICQSINEVPVTVFCKGAFFVRKELGALSCNTVGLDWQMDIEETRQIIGQGKTLQGNLDPAVLYGNENYIEQRTKEMLNKFGNSTRYIVNLGHGVYPDTEKEKVKFFIDTVKNHKINLN